MDLYQLIPDFPASECLDVYRRKATFDWKKLKIYIEGENLCRIKLEAFASLQGNTDFVVDKDDQLEHAYRRYKYTLQNFPFLKNQSDFSSSLFHIGEVIGMIDTGTIFKRFLSYEIAASLLRSKKGSTYEEVKETLKNVRMRNRRLAQLNDLRESRTKVTSGIVLTEVGHGSNLQKLQTTATYDKDSKCFILHTPTIEAWKCWSANIGKTATHAMTVAQLYTPDGECHGLHWFFVPIRNPRTMKPFPGVLVGHMGKKIGLNNVDNGFMAFINYRIPRTALLNGHSDVTEEGHYVTSIPNSNRRFAYTAEELNITRLGTMFISQLCLTKGIIIGVRYAAVRKQFSSNGNEEEVRLLEYPLHQLRLMPYLSSAIIFKMTFSWLDDDYSKQKHRSILQNVTVEEDERGMHLLIISLKSLITWIAKDGLQEIREACGGFGYLAAAGIGDARNVNDAHVTLEGDNNVLQLNINKFLLIAFVKRAQEKKMKVGYGLLDFMTTLDQPTGKLENVEHLMTAQGIVKAYEILICHLLSKMSAKVSDLMEQRESAFNAFNLAHTFFGKALSYAFSEWIIIRRYFHQLSLIPPPPDAVATLTNIGLLFGLWRLQNNILYLCEANYIGIEFDDKIRNKITELCVAIKGNAVSLVDVLAPPDEFLNSVLGSSDGEVYKRLISSFLYDEDHLTRPSWWKEMTINSELTSNL